MRRLARLFAAGVLVLSTIGCATVDRQGSSQAETHYILGVSYLQEQDPTRALKEFLRAAELAPKDARIQAALAQSYQLKKAYPEAERHYLRALKLGGPDSQIQNNLGSLYVEMQRWDDAIRQFRAASEDLTFTNTALSLTGLGYAHAGKGDLVEAAAAYQRAIRENPRYVPAHFLLGEAYVGLGKPELAIGAYRQALTLAPDSVIAHFQLGLAYMKLEEREKAVAAFREVLRLAPDSDLGAQAAEYLRLTP